MAFYFWIIIGIAVLVISDYFLSQPDICRHCKKELIECGYYGRMRCPNNCKHP